MVVIEDIYRSSARLSERDMRKDKKYTKAKNQVKQYYHHLCERLSENELATLNKLISSYDAKSERRNAHCFKAGFEMGLTVAVESFK